MKKEFKVGQYVVGISPDLSNYNKVSKIESIKTEDGNYITYFLDNCDGEYTECELELFQKEETKSDIELLKEKFKSGDYVCVFRNEHLVRGKWLIDSYPSFIITNRYKLIHKKHKDILNAYLDGKEIEVFIMSEWHKVKNFIEEYNENSTYQEVGNGLYKQVFNNYLETKSNCEDTAVNNGGSTDYYKLPLNAKDLQDLIEHKDMNFSLGNIFKACYRLGSCSHSEALRDLNKIVWFANREIERINK